MTNTISSHNQHQYVDGLCRALAQTLECHPSVVAAYLFGSVAAGRHRSGSDIDVAILIDREQFVAESFDRKRLYDVLLPELCRAVRGDVDLLILNDASLLVRAQVFEKGRLFYEDDSQQMAEFRAISISQYADFAPIMKRTREGFYNR